MAKAHKAHIMVAVLGESAELTAHWKNLCSQYPVYSIEDGLDEEDWEGTVCAQVCPVGAISRKE